MNDIQTYIQRELGKGKSHDEIREALRQAGWNDNAIDNAFSQAEPSAPQANASHTDDQSRLNFLYTLSFITLYTAVYAFVRTSFGAIDMLFDPANVADSQTLQENLRWHLATLVVVFPVFLLVNAGIRRMVARQHIEVHFTGARKNFTYVTLFVAALFLIGSAIALVYQLTGGEFLSQSILKLSVLILVTGSLFGYYFQEVREGRSEEDNEKDNG